MKKTKNIKKANDEVTKLVEMIFIVLVVFAAFYIITIFVTKNQKSTNSDQVNESEDTIIQYDEILLGNIFDQNPNEYYVVVTDDESNYKESIEFYIQTYNQKDEHIRVYTSSINEKLNANYVSENSKLDTDNINEFKVKTITLIKIKDKKIEYRVEGELEVTKKLAEISK